MPLLFPFSRFSIPRGSPKYTPPVSSLTIKISRSWTISFLRDEESESEEKHIAGLKLAKRSKSFLRRNKPASGLCS